MFHKRLVRHIVDHVVPTEHNGFVPHLLKAPAIWAILGVGVSLFGFSQFLHITDYLNIKAEVYPTTIVELTNHDREAVGLAPLSVSPMLEAAAHLKAQDMVDNNYFAHTSPAGINPWHWFKQANYQFRYAGENLAVNFDQSGDVETAWLNSPTHRANIMSANFTEIGIATAHGVYENNPTTFVVELFGMPAVSKPVSPTTTPPVPAVTKTASVPVQSPSATAVNQPAPANAAVAGESTQSSDATLRIVDESQDSVSVEDTDPTLVQKPVTAVETARVPFFTRTFLQLDKYIGAIMEVIVVGLIMAMATLITREQQKHHRLHMAYGILMTVVLTSFLFIGRIGVFAETTAPIPVHPVGQFESL